MWSTRSCCEPRPRPSIRRRTRGISASHLRRYAHFTSPIRRYADLIVHRGLISALGLGNDGLTAEDIARLSDTADLVSGAERRAMAAERETIDRLIAAHLAGQTGSIFRGRIGGVVGAGLFITLNDTGADGFVPVSTLGREYFVYDQTHALIGESTGETFQLGDRVEVKLVEDAGLGRHAFRDDFGRAQGQAAAAAPWAGLAPEQADAEIAEEEIEWFPNVFLLPMGRRWGPSEAWEDEEEPVMQLLDLLPLTFPSCFAGWAPSSPRWGEEKNHALRQAAARRGGAYPNGP